MIEAALHRFDGAWRHVRLKSEAQRAKDSILAPLKTLVAPVTSPTRRAGPSLQGIPRAVNSALLYEEPSLAMCLGHILTGPSHGYEENTRQAQAWGYYRCHGYSVPGDLPALGGQWPPRQEVTKIPAWQGLLKAPLCPPPQNARGVGSCKGISSGTSVRSTTGKARPDTGTTPRRCSSLAHRPRRPQTFIVAWHAKGIRPVSGHDASRARLLYHREGTCYGAWHVNRG